jgi:hypothetical protein
LPIPYIAVTHRLAEGDNNEMSDLQPLVKLYPSTKPRLPSARMRRKVAIYFLAILIVSVMVIWFGFLGWGFVAILQRLLDGIKEFWTYL